MAKVACPYCYQRIDNSALAFQCLGIGAPGRPGCTPENDPRRTAVGFEGNSLPVFPAPRSLLMSTRATCDRCGGETGVRACPECHTPLPTTFVGSTSPLVGMVGGVGAGKTVYMTVLDHQLRTTVRRRFDADIRLAGDRQGGESSTREYIARYQRALFERGTLLEQTQAARDSRKAPIVLEWRQPSTFLGRTTYRTTTLSFYDTAGEDLTAQERVHTQAYLGVADGLIVLLDPWQIPALRDQLDVPDAAAVGADPPLEVVKRVTELLRASHGVKASRSIKVPVAVVFAKVDALLPVLGPSDPLFAPSRPTTGYDEQSGQDLHEYVAALLEKFGADDVDSHLRANYSAFRYFAVSALGAQPDYENGAVDPGGVAPLRVEEPLLWLLNRFKVIERAPA